MKIALNIIGQYRTFEKTYQNIYDYLIKNNKHYKFDIILNTDFKNKDIIDYNNKTKNKYHYEENELLKKFNNCYGNNLIKIINYNVNEIDKKNGAFEIFKKRINQNIKYFDDNKMIYDLYIFIRFDVKFTKKIDLSKYFYNNISFICGKNRNHKRLDHYRDWDYCIISNNLLFIDYYINPIKYNFNNNLDYKQIINFSNEINFKTKYINIIKKEKKIINHWIKNYWFLFYNIFNRDCKINFEENIYLKIVR